MTKNKYFYICLFLGIMLSTWHISANWYQLVLVRGDSMVPAYHNMQLVLADRHSGDYTYGDVIAFHCDGLDTVLIKRIAACPGDEVKIEDGCLYINGGGSTVFAEGTVFSYAGIAELPVQMADGQYFVIGDNIEKSKDSRYREVGCVNENRIIGKII